MFPIVQDRDTTLISWLNGNEKTVFGVSTNNNYSDVINVSSSGVIDDNFGHLDVNGQINIGAGLAVGAGVFLRGPEITDDLVHTCYQYEISGATEDPNIMLYAICGVGPASVTGSNDSVVSVRKLKFGTAAAAFNSLNCEGLIAAPRTNSGAADVDRSIFIGIGCMMNNTAASNDYTFGRVSCRRLVGYFPRMIDRRKVGG